MVARQRSAEEWVTELDSIINQYRNGEPRAAPMTRKQAIELGFSEGDAVRYLDRNRSKPAVSWK
ncbi:MAG TPA: hypothetical protein VGU20_32220 [Stellaceae bacterium]|nr:hypothetical protein [Stellaceae bacterium]